MMRHTRTIATNICKSTKISSSHYKTRLVYKILRSSYAYTMTSRDDRPPAHAHARSNHTYLDAYTARPFIHIWTDSFFVQFKRSRVGRRFVLYNTVILID